LVLDIIQATFVTVPIMDLPTSSLNSQGVGTQAKMSNVTKHMPTQFQLKVSRQQMGRAPRCAWLERRGHPCMISSQFVSMCLRVYAIQFPPYCMQLLTQIDPGLEYCAKHKLARMKFHCSNPTYGMGWPCPSCSGRQNQAWP